MNEEVEEERKRCELAGHSARGAPLIFHRSWENRIDNVPHPDAVRGPHAEGIEARNSHSFAAHRERGTLEKQSKTSAEKILPLSLFLFRSLALAIVNGPYICRAAITVEEWLAPSR